MLQERQNHNELIHAAALGVLVIASFFYALGSGPLFDVDEGAFSEATREMLASKNFLTTYLNGVPRFDKPVLIYWFQALSVTLFGLTEFAFRLPSALAGSIWAGAIYLFARKELGSRRAFLAAALMILSLQVTIIAKAAIADALLNCFLAISMFAVYRHLTTGSKPARNLAFAAIGLGVLTKGPIAMLIPLAVSFLFSLQQRSLKKWFTTVLNPTGIIIFLLIVMPWYTLEYLDQGMAFIQGFFFKHNINRFNSSLEGHSGSLFYYFPVILLGLMPFTGLLFTTLFNLKKLLAEPLNIFLAIWFGFVFIFFSLSGTKLPHYMIYGYTPLFLLMARVFDSGKHPKLLVLWPLLFIILLGALPSALPVAMERIDDAYISAILHDARIMLDSTYLMVIGMTALLLVATITIPALNLSWRLIAQGVVLTLLVNLFLMPVAAELLQIPVREAANLARKEGYKVVMWKVYYPSFFVYSGTFAERRAPEKGDIVLTTVKYLPGLDNPDVLYQKHGIVLVNNK
ncbi:MAG: glycosyltransferase family 39 protein [Chlorobiaceae bacterium]|nr:glycosyltransferase family 39 protein [Chlorobiaceae bacterium]